MIASTALILGTSVVLGLVYLLLKKRYRYWADRSVPYLEPNLIFGNMKDVLWDNIPHSQHNNRIYKELAPHKVGGFFKFQKPALVIRDPELVKHVLLKDFINFHDRSADTSNEHDILNRHLFNLTGETWKNLRTKLTPTFTSGKMKSMFQLIKECADLLAKVVDETIQTNSELEMKDLLARYSTDIISSCAFGVQSRSLENPETKFRVMGKRIMEPTLGRKIINILNLIIPGFTKVFRMSMFDAEIQNFFINLISQTVKYRETTKFIRSDFIQILIDLKNGEKSKEAETNNSSINKLPGKVEMTLEVMMAQVFLFFVAGFETSSSVLSYCLLELAHHPDIQERVRKELQEALEKTDGEITYDLIQQLPYMDKVVNETMRMYPTLPILFRQCTKTYNIPNMDIVIDEGTDIVIPVYGLHHDPQYYPNPEEFNPENFTNENKASRPHFTFLPFGEGPRNCIGLRFGLMQVKSGLAALIKNYRFQLSPKIQLPVKFKPNSILTASADGIWLNTSKVN